MINNFQLVRIVVALAVVAFHSNPTALGPGQFPAWTAALGFPGYQVPVDIFFCISGYLVTYSLVSRRNLLDFAGARIRRIVPAAAVSVVGTVLVVGLFFTSLPLGRFLSDRQTIRFVAEGLVPLVRMDAYLPGAFHSNPLRGLVNASLWTLVWEVRMYIMLAFLWWVSRRNLDVFGKVVGAAWLGVGVFSLGIWLHGTTEGIPALIARFCPVFLGGALLQLYPRLAPKTLVAALLLMSWGILWVNVEVFHFVYGVTLPYVVVWLCLIPSGPLLWFNSVGDFSYGVYIYSFPTQQVIAALFPGIGFGRMLLVAGTVSVCLGYFSWHLIEKRILRR